MATWKLQHLTAPKPLKLQRWNFDLIFCTFDYVRETNRCAKFGWNPPARGRFTHTCVFSSWFLTAFFSCAPAQAKRIETNSRTMAQKTQFGVRSALPASVFLSFDVLGVILPKKPKISPPSKSRITSKPFKIDKKCLLNMIIKSMSPFQNPSCKLAWGSPWRRNHYDVISGLQ